MEKDAPEYLYKYTEYQYALDLLNHGSLKLGTISSYRDIEQYEHGVGDLWEGMRTIIWPDLRTGTWNKSSTKSSPCGLYCLSDEFDLTTMVRMDPKYDTVVRIKTRDFFADLAAAIAPQCRVISLHKVQYLTTTELNIRTPLRQPPFVRVIKEKHHYYERDFSYQSEWRICFEPLESMTGPTDTIRPVPDELLTKIVDGQLAIHAGHSIAPELVNQEALSKICDQFPTNVPGLTESCEIVYRQ
jgi:hypothetical protein